MNREITFVMLRIIFENILIQHFQKAKAFVFCQYSEIRFFEILFILEEERKINGHKLHYHSNQLFILVPNDKYNFEVEKASTVSAIKFLKNLFL